MVILTRHLELESADEQVILRGLDHRRGGRGDDWKCSLLAAVREAAPPDGSTYKNGRCCESCRPPHPASLLHCFVSFTQKVNMVAVSHLLTRVIAGIPVPNTPLINSSIALARAALPDQGYNHVMRSWLNGQAIINNLPIANRSQIDQEAFGIATILHDLGWYTTPSLSHPFKRKK